MISEYQILGSGGGGRTAASIIEFFHMEQGWPRPAISFLDDADRRSSVNDYPVIGSVSRAWEDPHWPAGTAFIVAFGSMCMSARERAFSSLRESGRAIFNAIHPRATIDRCSSIGVGNIIAANCVVHPNARVGNNCFFCVAATVDHDNNIGDNVYLSPGVHLAGGVVVEDNVFIGTGAVVLPGVRIGQGAVIGAGAAVIRDIAAGYTAVGVPARTTDQRR